MLILPDLETGYALHDDDNNGSTTNNSMKMSCVVQLPKLAYYTTLCAASCKGICTPS